MKSLNDLLPRHLPGAPRHGAPAVHVAPLLVKAATSEVSEVYSLLETGPAGLTEAQAIQRRQGVPRSAQGLGPARLARVARARRRGESPNRR
jgi:hypothetical protein